MDYIAIKQKWNLHVWTTYSTLEKWTELDRENNEKVLQLISVWEKILLSSKSFENIPTEMSLEDKLFRLSVKGKVFRETWRKTRRYHLFRGSPKLT